MPNLTTQGFRALARSDVSLILDQSSIYPSDKSEELPVEMHFRSFKATGSPGNLKMHTSAEIKAAMERWCRDAFAFVDPSSGHDLNSHLAQLDAHLSTLLVCNFQTYKQDMGEAAIVDNACALLDRLPSNPPELPFQHEGPKAQDAQEKDQQELWPAAYFVANPIVTDEDSGEKDNRGRRYDWASLQVLSRPSTNTIRLAIFKVMDRSDPLGYPSEYSETLASLLDTVTGLLGESSTEEEAKAWFILQAFLWAAWQHTIMIHLWYDAKRQMYNYKFYNHNDIVAHQIPAVMPQRESIERSRPNYMCKWAFELLRSDLSCVTQDFRKFFEIYEEHFGGRGPRCNLLPPGHEATIAQPKRICDGKAPGNCQRFESEGVQIQGAHDFSCPGPGPDSPCHFLVWDEASYLNTRGARAVSLEDTDDTHIRYTPVTRDTMAVSHVWSHGQGGRPETGFNSCLHRRYVTLARSLGCTSYWMDTPCVPTERTLRSECLGQINANFETSKVTLLVDRDIMEIDINPRTLAAEEAILAALVVCDWNVRAWTLLEGMRGRVRLHFLCKNNHVISLADVLNDVLSKSCLSLVSLCLAVQHYIPIPEPPGGIDLDPVSIEQATCLLNHRHATKDRDVPMIWALVAGSPTVIKASEEFWLSKVGKFLNTGNLISSAPRIPGRRGIGWAPARPNLLPPNATTDEKRYPAYDGQNSVPGKITAEGFEAEWLAAILRRRGMGLPAWLFSIYRFPRESEWDEYYHVYNKGGSDRIDLKMRQRIGELIAPLFQRFRYVAFLLPLLRYKGTNGAAIPPQPFQYQGEAEGPVMVVVGSNNQKEWEWQFLYEWKEEQLPEFWQTQLLLV
ncbi:hypothetical protein BDW67DRAFT_193799 [Aspergillus spinulosporus]